MNDKIYPDQTPRKRDAQGCWRQLYRGSVSVLILQEEAEHLATILEDLYSHDDLPEELGETIEALQSQVDYILINGRGRMERLHSLLGAYDIHQDGKLSKPESERIDYSKYRSPYAPKLELVRKDK